MWIQNAVDHKRSPPVTHTKCYTCHMLRVCLIANVYSMNLLPKSPRKSFQRHNDFTGMDDVVIFDHTIDIFDVTVNPHK